MFCCIITKNLCDYFLENKICVKMLVIKLLNNFRAPVMESGLSCSLSFLLWSSQVNEKPCSGPIVGIGFLNDLVHSKWVGSDKTVYNTADLLLNRISPYPLTQENVAGLDVCKSHLVS